MKKIFKKSQEIRLKSEKFPDFFLNIFFFFVFLYQPCIISSLFSILECVSFYPQPGGYYIKRYLNEKCFTNSHLAWVFILVLPALLVYLLLIPILEFWKEKKTYFANNYIIYW